MFFQGQTLYWTYLRNGWSDWYETKRRCIGLILGELCSRSNFKIAVSHELLFDRCETKRKKNQSDTELTYGLALFPHPWPWPCNFKVKLSNSLTWGMAGLIDMKRKGCELIIHDHDRDLWINVVGWVEVPDSDCGDFRRRRAVDISISLCEDYDRLHTCI